MAANDKIGDVDKIVIQTRNNVTGIIQESSLNKNCYPNKDATYQQVNDATRAISELSRNEYEDTICITNISVTEQLAN